MKKFLMIAVMLFAVMNLSIAPKEEATVMYETYKVRAGDTFWDIANYYREKDARNMYILEYQDEVRELNPWLEERRNQLQPNDVIQVRYVKKISK